jgi:hypothetical protein
LKRKPSKTQAPSSLASKLGIERLKETFLGSPDKGQSLDRKYKHVPSDDPSEYSDTESNAPKNDYKPLEIPTYHQEVPKLFDDEHSHFLKPVEYIPAPQKSLINLEHLEEPKLSIFSTLQNLIGGIWKLHRETSIGPRQLGPINTTLYDNYNLESELMELLEEMFEFREGKAWLYVQLQYFLKPLIHRLGSHIVNR